MSQRQQNEDRMRRADSWCNKGLMDIPSDEKFIFLWIAFNAAYGRELHDPDICGPDAYMCSARSGTSFTARRETPFGVDSSRNGTIEH